MVSPLPIYSSKSFPELSKIDGSSIRALRNSHPLESELRDFSGPGRSTNRFHERNPKMKKFLLFVVAVCLFSVSVAAQTSSTGTLTGVVKDEKGAVVPGATVTLIKIGTNVSRSAQTSGEGTYEIPQLVPGTYRLEVEASNFAKFEQEEVVVNVLSRVTVDAVLKPAGTVASVTVTAENTALVETTKTEVSGVIDQRQMESLPVNGRSFASLAVLIPGATLQPSFDPTKARVGTFSVGGSTGRNLNITVDGGDNKDNAVGGILQNFSMEGIQEFALSTQRFSAANGRSGGALLSVVS